MWSFPLSGAEDSNRRPKLDEFFKSQQPTTSVVREALQNSLDAKDRTQEEPVRVRFTISSHPWDRVREFLETTDSGLTVNSHTSSNDLGGFAEDLEGKDIRCLAIEDYGTKGLTGSIDKEEARSGSNFVGFWWNEGITGKGKGTRGNHGVGKTTLTRVSALSSFLAVTKRFDDSQTFLIGFCNLPFHQIDGRSYLGHARYGERITEGAAAKFVPIDDAATIELFVERFGLDRSQTGLSVLIPAVDDDVQHDTILAAALEDYYWPIMQGELEVEICDAITDTTTKITSRTIGEAAARIDNASNSENVAHLIDAARLVANMRAGSDPNYFRGIEPEDLNDGSLKPLRISRKCFTDQNLTRMKDQFARGKLIGVQFIVDIDPVDEDDQVRGTFDVFLRKQTESGSSAISQFIRQGIIISEQTPGINGKYDLCFVIAEDQDMSDYLGAAEGPAHTKWLLGTLRENRRYRSDVPLRLVMNAAAELFRVLEGDDEDKDKLENYANDIFSISRPATGKTSKKAKSGPRKKSEKPAVPPPPAPVELIRTDKRQDGTGFSIRAVDNIDEAMDENDLAFPFRVKVEAAYLSVRGNARSFRDYSEIDFAFGRDVDVEVDGNGTASILSAEKNEAEVEMTGAGFEVVIKGFDSNRDVLVRTKVLA